MGDRHNNDGPRDDPERHTGTNEEHFRETVGRKADRKLAARRREDRGVWFWLGMFGLVGWSVALPTILAVALGVWIDKTWPSEISWTLTLLFVGVVVGCLNAWYWVRQESGSR